MPPSKILTGAVVIAFVALSGCSANPRRTVSVAAPVSAPDRTAQAFAGLEQRYHARLGVYVVDPATGRVVAYRSGERFAYASTAKVLTTTVLLKRVTDAELDQVVHYSRSDVLEWAPITKKHVRTGMKVRDLMSAALRYSDNTAENLLLERIGGPRGLQAALPALGDTTTHADRTEPSLNEAARGDIRDTSTPRVLGADLRSIVLGDVLPPNRRSMLTKWLVTNTTGGPYIRAGVPSGWKVGDKTGNADWGTRNDIAIAWPPGRSPIGITVLSDRKSQNASSDDALIADATKVALTGLR